MSAQGSKVKKVGPKVKRLKAARVIPPNHELSDKDHDALESLSDDEVDAIISAKKKLGPGFQKRNALENGVFF